MPEKAPVINPKPTVARAVWIVFVVVTPLLGPRAAAALSNIVPEMKTLLSPMPNLNMRIVAGAAPEPSGQGTEVEAESRNPSSRR